MKSLEQLTKKLKATALQQGMEATVTIEKKQGLVPDSWDDAFDGSGAFMDGGSTVQKTAYLRTIKSNRSVFKSESLAEAALAIAQLSHLRAETWKRCGNWAPDEKDEAFVISFEHDGLKVNKYFLTDMFLIFPTDKVAELFLLKHRDLIERAEPILGCKID